MTGQDYNALTVVQIKEILKERGIALKGLTRKQQLIDRLLEVDAEHALGAAPAPTPQAGANERVTDANSADAYNSQDATESTAPAPEVSADEQCKTADESVAVAEEVQDSNTGGQNDDGAGTSQDLDREVEGSTTRAENVNGKASPEAHKELERSLKEPQQPPDPPLEASSMSVQDVAPAAEESRKRKRRSATPPVDEDEIAKKRVRQDGGGHKIEEATETDAQDVAIPDAVMQDISEERKVVNEPAGARSQSLEGSLPLHEEALSATEHLPQDLTALEERGPVDADAPPSLHRATSALYIRNLKRPIRAEALEQHLQALGNIARDTPLPDFYLNHTRTHAFATFVSPALASRVRARLHRTIWPEEPQREQLWVDFVPPDAIQAWIKTEEDAGAAGRFEVVYDGQTESARAIHRVAETSAPAGAPRGPSGVDHAIEAGRETGKDSRPAEKPTASFLKLDELFKSTKTKPKLYYLPVSERVVERRLDELDRLAARPLEGASGQADATRFTFDDDCVVDDGPEYGWRAGGGVGGGGGRGRGRGGGRGGPYRPPREGMRAWR